MVRVSLFVLAAGMSQGCAPSEEEMRATGQLRLGKQGRSVAIGYVDPPQSARSCCCPTEQRWFDLADRPQTCEIYPDLAETDRFFRGSSYLDAACLTREGFLEARETRRLVVACADVACEGEAAGGPAPLTETVQVFVPTDALNGLAREGTSAESIEYFLGYDTLGTLLEQERKGWDRVQTQFQLKETVTPLEACVLEGRSRRPSNNRKQDFEFRREDGAWR